MSVAHNIDHISMISLVCFQLTRGMNWYISFDYTSVYE